MRDNLKKVKTHWLPFKQSPPQPVQNDRLGSASCLPGHFSGWFIFGVS